MKRITLSLLTVAATALFGTSCTCDSNEKELQTVNLLLKKDYPHSTIKLDNAIFTKKQMALVAEYQIKHLKKHAKRIKERRWELAPFYRGLAACYRITKDKNYLDLMKKIAKDANYQLGLRKGHADDQAIVQLYLELADFTNDKSILAQAREDFTEQMTLMPKYKFRFRNYCHRWSWADALFMAPPAWAKLSTMTGDNTYMNFMVTEFKTNTNKLFSDKYHLYFRDERYINKLNKNGKNIFWSRGNGWVYGGLASVIQWMPQDHESKLYFEDLFKKMSSALIKWQNPRNGLWAMNIIDHNEYPLYETSGTAFFCYGLFWGMNNGLLDVNTYLPYAVKSWNGLNEKVTAEGRVTYVQPVGYAPDKFKPNDTEIYGVGAYLMAAEEYLKFINNNKFKQYKGK
ncbi:glycoside hydrolase family 88 protein [Lentisphaerota bacterium WC36G]|nr:glycoside hydrolase family 88 protein [Lentisphaerae bacterium WC36]